MAAGPFVIPDKAKLNFFSSGTLAATTNFRLALVDSTWIPAQTTNELFADVTGELPTGAGYTAGGATLTGVVLSQTSGSVKFTSSTVVFTSSGTFPAWRRCVVYYLGTLNGKVNPLVGHFLGDAAPADVPVTTTGNTISVTPNALGFVSA